jgi:hypothetical protein
MVPVGDVLAEDDQLGTGNGLGLVQLLQDDVGGRTAGAAFGSEELNENWGVGVRCGGGRGFGGGLRALRGGG